MTQAEAIEQWEAGARKVLDLTVFNNPYIKMEYDNPRQLYFLTLMNEEVMYGGSAGGGKRLPLDTPIPTPEGWTTMGNIFPGQTIFGRKGQPVHVMAVSKIEPAPESYLMIFDDGFSMMADAEHDWLTFTAKDLENLTRRNPEWMAKRKLNRPSRASGKKSTKFSQALATRNSSRQYEYLPAPEGSIKSTREISKTLIVRGKRLNHAIPIAGALITPEANLPLDPYLFGLWLGDGSSYGYQYTTADPELLAAWQDGGFEVKKWVGLYSYGIHGLNRVLRKLWVLREQFGKHIPREYLRGSIEQRIALLQGLMDTDGHACDSGSCEFTSVNRRLAENVLELILSLGHKAQIRTVRAMLRGKDCGEKYRIKWTPPVPVFRLPKKLDRQKISTRRTTQFRYVVSCNPVPPVPMRCISVDAVDGIYLAGQAMVPTHNSVGLLAAALQFVQSPGYSALLLRKTFQDLNQPGALIPRAHEWLGGTDAHWKEAEHSWTFPTRSVLKFGYLDSPSDIYQFQSSEFCFIGFDEGTQFREYDYRYMFSRLRKPAKLNLPLRMRMGTNPGGIGHEWVKRRFLVEGRANGRFFVPAGLRDNPHLNPAEYEQSLAQLDPITRRQLLNGDWSARAGGLFRTEWFSRIIPVKPVQVRNWVRFWDLAATAPKAGTDPDYTAGCLIGMHDGTIYIADMKRIRDKPRVIENLIRTTAQLDGRSVRVRMEEELGSAGKNLVDHYQRHILPGMDFAGVKPTGDSQVLAGPMASAAEAGNVVLVRGLWNGPFLDEVEGFPEGHDDQIKACCLGLQEVVARPGQFKMWIPKAPPAQLPAM